METDSATVEELLAALREYRKRHHRWAWLKLMGDGSGTVQLGDDDGGDDYRDFESISELMAILSE